MVRLRAGLGVWQQTTGELVPGEERLKKDDSDRRSGEKIQKKK